MNGQLRAKRHNPYARPLGCNGKYGASGTTAHRKRGETPCAACSESNGHYVYETKTRGLKPRKLQPCGTNAAAIRHRRRGEELCFPCRLAQAKDRNQRYHAGKAGNGF